TLFRLERYLDPIRYPSLAIGIIRLPDADAAKPETGVRMTADKRRRALVDAATDPIRSAQRFPLWEWLGHLGRYVTTHGPHPLVDHLPHPGAAFCEYAYEAAGLDLTPGATAPTTCPELLWSTLLHWSGSIGAKEDAEDRVRVWSSDLSGVIANRATAAPT